MPSSPTKSLPLAGLKKTTYILVSLIAVVAILHYTQEYVIPFIMALIIWFIIHELRENLQMIKYVREKVPTWIQSLVSFFVIIVVIFMIVELLLVSLNQLTQSVDIYEANFKEFIGGMSNRFGMDLTAQFLDLVNEINVSEIIGGTLDYATGLLGNVFLIFIYIIFLLIEETVFEQKLKAIYPSESTQKKNQALFQKMDKNMSRYLSLKTLVSLLTGFLSYIALVIIGVDGAIFWALLIFVLNYIPTVGSLIATVFPALFAIVQFGSLTPSLYILGSVGAIQVIVGNVIEPKVMGNSLNMSSLVVILSLTIWGAIWGVMGMILSVPITVMMIIVCEDIPSLRFVAIALSEKGNIKMLNEPEE